MIILQFWIHPGTFYGICAPHKLPPSNCPLKRRLMIKLEILLLRSKQALMLSRRHSLPT
jgi:hypothetical protein